MSSNDSESWIKAMDKEIESLNENNTWELVEKIPNKKVIDVKVVYSKKSDDTYKARLVVRGFIYLFTQSIRYITLHSNPAEGNKFPVCRSGVYLILIAFLNLRLHTKS